MRCAAALLAVLLGALTAFAAEPAPPPAPWHSKVSDRVWTDLERGDADFLVVLAEQADLSEAAALSSKEEKGAFVVERLRETAARTQGPLLDLLRAQGVEFQPFWVANFIRVRGGYGALEAAARLAAVGAVEPNPLVVIPEPPPEELSAPPTPQAVEWGVAKVNADDVWALGFTGQGVVVGGQDTGYQWDHPALKAMYRGWSGTAADHNYSWHDAIHSGGGTCGANTAAPCDDYGHGTHTMGTMVGTDGGANQIGVAPGAKWIGCRNMDVGNGTPATYAECFQWFLAPTDLAGANPDPSKAPDVMNNSWGCPTSEGCTDVNVLKTVVENCRAAGIVVVVSAGNSGSACSTVTDPPAIYDASITVGNTTSSDGIATSSSRGPVTVDGSGRMKPDVSAPGSSIRSAYPGNTYSIMSGTSMAGPHVVGAVALLLSARPDLKGQVGAVKTILTHTAQPLTGTQTCGGVAGTTVPNNTFGWGRLDALALLAADTDGDGVANRYDCDPVNAANPASTEARSLSLSGRGTTAFTWQAPLSPGGTAVHYDLLRSTSPSDFSSATCVVSGTMARSASDATLPTGTPVLYYLVRARNTCGGSLGTRSDGTPRTGKSCP